MMKRGAAVTSVPDFHQLALDIRDLFAKQASGETDVSRRAEVILVDVWNARGAADIEALQGVWDERAPAAGVRSMAAVIRTLDRSTL
jgi:hypothetical protein